jgi:hypothetical protein
MIYWRIKQPGKSWRNWAEGTAEDVEQAQVDAMDSVLDDNNQLEPWAQGGVNVEMWRCTDIEDFVITPENTKTFRTNYLGLPS